MFQCYVCGKSIGPNIKPIPVVTERRTQAYHNEYFTEDEWGNKQQHEVDSTGVEIVTEVLSCGPCGREFYDIPEQATRTVKSAAPKFEEKLAPPLPLVLFEAMLANAMNRTLHNTKRAEQDSLVAIPLVKEFVTNNPKFGQEAN